MAKGVQIWLSYEHGDKQSKILTAATRQKFTIILHVLNRC